MTNQNFKVTLPDVLTMCNLWLGLIAILFLIEGLVEFAMVFRLDESNLWSRQALIKKYFSLAGLCILTASVFDALDGASARALNMKSHHKKSTSPAGKYIDSLADIISFGVAPGIFFYAITLSIGKFPSYSLSLYQTSSLFSSSIPFNHFAFSILSIAFFPLCAAKRLIDYHNHNHKSTTHFNGCPSTIAASLIVLIFIFNFYPTSLLPSVITIINNLLQSTDLLFYCSQFAFSLKMMFSNYLFLFFIYLTLALAMLMPIPFLKLSVILKSHSKFKIISLIFIFLILLSLFFKYTLLSLYSSYLIVSLSSHLSKKLKKIIKPSNSKKKSTAINSTLSS